MIGPSGIHATSRKTLERAEPGPIRFQLALFCRAEAAQQRRRTFRPHLPRERVGLGKPPARILKTVSSGRIAEAAIFAEAIAQLWRVSRDRAFGNGVAVGLRVTPSANCSPTSGSNRLDAYGHCQTCTFSCDRSGRFEWSRVWFETVIPRQSRRARETPREFRRTRPRRLPASGIAALSCQASVHRRNLQID